VKAGASLDPALAVRALEELVDRVLLVEEPLPLGEEVAEAVDAAPDLAADKPVSKSSVRISSIIVSALGCP
jgi:hypothetical protein